jgi:hypothetical protein
VIHDADAWAEIGDLAVDWHGRSELADIEQRLPTLRGTQSARPVHVVPLRLVLAVGVEHLDAMVLAICDVHPAIGVGADVVGNIELTRIASGLTPRQQQLAVG